MLVPLLLAVFVLLLSAATASATTRKEILQALASQNVFVHPAESHPGDLQSLERAASRNAAQGVPTRFAILQSYPSAYPNAAAVASDFRHALGFSGAMIVVTPHDIGISSDRLSSSEDTKIAQEAAPRCLTQTLTSCAIYAGNQAVAQIKADKASSNQQSAIFWAVVLAIVALIILVLVFMTRRRLSAITGRRNDLYRAASNTLSLADNAVEEIESATAGRPMDSGIRGEYDAALALRDQARNELERARSPEMLTQANQDAAQAVLALQGVMRRLGISSPLANPLEAPGRRCFYCAHDDRPPYTQETIEDGRDNSMVVDVCRVCREQLAAGRRPQIATVNYGGATVPWWAMPGNPWYYSYGGPSWQNWLPFFAGLELGSWFGGGWGGGPGWGFGDYDDGGWAGADAGSSVGADVPSDAGGVDFGSPADSSGWDTSGWNAGGDSGGWDNSGWDSGGDSGGWDSGGDSGGWDGGGGGNGW